MQENGQPYLLAWIFAGFNLLLFVPFGTIVSLLQGKKAPKRSFIYVTMESFFLSTLIEITQKITKLGYCETEDIILNTLGGMIGWCIARCILFLEKAHSD